MESRKIKKELGAGGCSLVVDLPSMCKTRLQASTAKKKRKKKSKKKKERKELPEG